MGALDFIRSVFGRTGKPRKLYDEAPSKRVLTIRRLSETEWEYEQIASALHQADNGEFSELGRITDALRGDGTIVGQLSTRYDGLLSLPRYDEAERPEVKDALTKAFPTLAPTPELKLIASDGDICGFGIGEIIEPRRGLLTVIRHSPQHAIYKEHVDQWSLRTKEGLLPINPGDGRWILYQPYGRYMPWRNAIWRALARNYILKEHALLSLSAWNGSLATPAKVLEKTKGAADEEGESAIQQVDSWGFLPSYLLPEGWKLSLLQADQKSADSFRQMAELCDKDSILTISGQSGTTEQGAGFGNSNVFAAVKATLIQSTGNALAQCLNEQLLPTWADYTFGAYLGWASHPSVRWDTTPPRDRKADADAANMMMTALKAAKDLGADVDLRGTRIDLHTMCERYGIALLRGDGP
ncbi:MAG: DUF935 family protein [Labilithrix sp.]|nr:DUF935 family protein [Labilithrix sp.]